MSLRLSNKEKLEGLPGDLASWNILNVFLGEFECTVETVITDIIHGLMTKIPVRFVLLGSTRLI